MTRPIIADASPLIGLGAAGAFGLMRELFGTVTITRTVLEEVRSGGKLPGAAELEAALADGWIRVAPTPMGTWRFEMLDDGEASSIALALERAGASPPLLLMDDARGREHAAAHGLETLDLPGLLLAAKRDGHVDRLLPLFERLARRGFTVPEESVRAVLAKAGEAPPRRTGGASG